MSTLDCLFRRNTFKEVFVRISAMLDSTRILNKCVSRAISLVPHVLLRETQLVDRAHQDTSWNGLVSLAAMAAQMESMVIPLLTCAYFAITLARLVKEQAQISALSVPMDIWEERVCVCQNVLKESSSLLESAFLVIRSAWLALVLKMINAILVPITQQLVLAIITTITNAWLIASVVTILTISKKSVCRARLCVALARLGISVHPVSKALISWTMVSAHSFNACPVSTELWSQHSLVTIATLPAWHAKAWASSIASHAVLATSSTSSRVSHARTNLVWLTLQILTILDALKSAEMVSTSACINATMAILWMEMAVTRSASSRKAGTALAVPC